MSRIEILPDELANQIAAGEVIERPASVVKELVENSLDAGASRIDIQVEGSGTRLIRVIDNGWGMNEDDVLLSLERHATSKLTRKEQLSSINTMGFRGEAIPTIASVARLTIISRTADSTLGTQADIRYGELRKVHESGAACGTVVEVRDLFGNVPARRKFLKTARTESNHIEEVVVNTVLSRADLSLNYELNGHRVHSFRETGNLTDRLQRVMAAGKDLNFMAVSTPGQGKSIRLSGYLLPPEQSRPGRGRLRLFVNRRPVADRMISHAVSEGMQGFLMKGRRPNGVLFVNLPPDQVDVNVHPAKHEVRFPKPPIIHQLIVEAVRSALQDYQDRIKYSVFSPGAGTIERGCGGKEVLQTQEVQEHQEEPKSLEIREFEPRPLREPIDRGGMDNSRRPAVQRNGSRSAEKDGSSGDRFRAKPAAVEEPQSSEEPGGTEKDWSTNSPEKHTETPPDRDRDERASGLFDMGGGQVEPENMISRQLSYIGQFRDSYLLCESREGLVVIDQHAAHERLLYENLKKQYSEAKLSFQSLLFPEVIECDYEQERVLEDYREEIAGLGFEIEHFGGKSYAVKAVPAILSHLGPLEAVAGLFSSYLEPLRTGGSGPSRLEDVLAGMACKAAVKARHHLQEIEGKELLKRMQEADVFSHCPHGRPVLKQFSDEEIRKWFYRT